MPALPEQPRAERYRIARAADRTVTVLALRGGRRRRVRHVAVHSPTGLETGYGGSGPADLALSLLADLFETPTAARAYARPKGLTAEVWCLHQMFKARWLVGFEVPAGEARELDAQELYRWALQERERLRRPLAGPPGCAA